MLTPWGWQNRISNLSLYNCKAFALTVMCLVVTLLRAFYCWAHNPSLGIGPGSHPVISFSVFTVGPGTPIPWLLIWITTYIHSFFYGGFYQTGCRTEGFQSPSPSSLSFSFLQGCQWKIKTMQTYPYKGSLWTVFLGLSSGSVVTSSFQLAWDFSSFNINSLFF